MTRVSISNCNQFMDIEATFGDESKMFPVVGKAYGPGYEAALEDATDWLLAKATAAGNAAWLRGDDG